MKAVALISAGLDSILAARIIKEQGITIIPVYFRIPFCHARKDEPAALAVFSAQVQSILGAPLQIVDISREFLKVMANPEYGFGSQMNPCIDCKILMLRQAQALMPQWAAEFVVTGEVLGQRPMSQNRQSLQVISRRSGLGGLIVRPLSAQLLEETIPEQKGWIKRESLLNIGGRSRKPQFKLAARFGLSDYAQPAGGCLLTDPEFSRRLKDCMRHGPFSVDDVALLKVGRHFRLTESAKLIIGRNEKENEYFTRSALAQDYIFMTLDIPGPVALGRGTYNPMLAQLACGLVFRYSDHSGVGSAIIQFRQAAVAEWQRFAAGLPPEDLIVQYRI